MKDPKVGDIFRWKWNAKTLKERDNQKLACTLYWCCSQICVFKDDGKFWDTYWGGDSGHDSSFRMEDVEKRLSLKYVGNFDDLVKSNKSERAYYKDEDCVDINHANRRTGGFYLRKGAKKSFDKMQRIMKRNLKQLQSDADYAQRAVKALESKIDDLSVESSLTIIDGVSLNDRCYLDSDL